MAAELARRLRFAARAFAFYALVALLFQYLLVLVFQTLDVDAFTPLLDALPPGLRALMGSDPAALFTSRGSLAVVFAHPVMVVLHSAFAIAIASGALAGEIETRSIALVLTRPIRRWEVAAAAGLVLAAGNAALMAFLWTGTALWSAVYRLGSVDLAAFGWVAAIGLSVFWAIGGVALLASAATSEAGRAAGLGAAFALAAYIANYLADLNPAWGWLGRYSIFGAWDPQAIVRQGGGSVGDLLLPLGVAVVSAALALVVFSRRDIAV